MNFRYLLEAITTGSKTALITTAVGSFGLFIYSAAASEKIVYLTYAVIAIAMVSVLLGGLQSGLTAGSLGWFHGAVLALVYAVLVFIAKAYLFPVSGDFSANSVFAAGLLLAGMAGGVTGVNLSFSRRSKVRRRYMGL